LELYDSASPDIERESFGRFIEGAGEESGVTRPRRKIRVIVGLSVRRADIHLDMRAVII